MSPFDYLAEPGRDALPFTARRPILAGFLMVAGTLSVATVTAGHAMLAIWAGTVASQAPDFLSGAVFALVAGATAAEVFAAWVVFERTVRHLEGVWRVWTVRCPRDPSVLMEGWR